VVDVIVVGIYLSLNRQIIHEITFKRNEALIISKKFICQSLLPSWEILILLFPRSKLSYNFVMFVNTYISREYLFLF
jgi:hypothetical protein